MNADGTGVIEVSHNPSEEWPTKYDRASGWSPDGRVVVHSTRDGTERTYLANADGSDLQPLFPGEDFFDPHWSPDGSKLVATSLRDGNGEIYLMDADGTHAVNLSNRSAFDGFWHWGADPWTPDGSRIAFMGTYSSFTEVFAVGADGTGLVDVSNEHYANDAFMAWTPDGTRILMSSDRTGDLELYLVKADGSELVNITSPAVSDNAFYAVWVRRR
jgi:Tol biopolymer transport system component